MTRPESVTNRLPPGCEAMPSRRMVRARGRSVMPPHPQRRQGPIGGTATPPIDMSTIQVRPDVLIDIRWRQLGGSPGPKVGPLETVGSGYRIRYRHGAIYLKQGPT